MMSYGTGGMAWLMMIGLLVWVGLIVLAGVAVGRHLRAPTDRPVARPHRETPLEVLERRYAEGAIDTAEFDDARARIGPGS